MDWRLYGHAYLLYLALQALRSAWYGSDLDLDPARTQDRAAHGLRQGFLSNITNPNVLAF